MRLFAVPTPIAPAFKMAILSVRLVLPHERAMAENPEKNDLE